MIVYELVHRFRLSMIVNSPAEAQGFARQMACTSYRPPLDMQLPSEIIDIITRCWDASPKARPRYVPGSRPITDSYCYQAGT